ncbi:hypothetical protein N180_15300 [Pedobacter antarcticus 4BY]|uniref:Uncharacterized protein n=2 Tax=Pedobacter antarcticus TaxID=34086 RepID=A0A081PLR5_9SPHI|nr:hypothetical protein [Pedobacter antarcticus]KEQ31638.1 hypothetical protein N180_15300 [Pedobacter antarcticus 4BY]SFF35495.1 hypothetical protein SAMN03003324_03477 [Pedobacter antarcticus]
MEREYIRTEKPAPLPFDTRQLKTLDDVFWKKWIFYHLLSFYKNYDNEELKEKIEAERKNKPARIEREIAKFIRLKLKANWEFGLNFSVKGEETNDENVEGNYDITIHNTYWKNKDFFFECKNLDGSQDLVNKYVCCNTYKKDSNGENIFDGGVLRYFNGKYAQNSNFGGMIGFILTGDIPPIKNNLVTRLKEKLHTTPEGDLIKVTDNSIEENSFTFDSLHKRFDKEFIIHHLLFDFSK